MRNKLIKGIGLLLLVLFLRPEIKAAEGLDLGVTPLMPDNQRTEGVNYFDLLLDQGQEQTVKLLIENSGDSERVVNIQLYPATTNYNGVVEYSDAERDESRVPFDIKEAVTFQEKWKIGANETAEIPIEIQMPEVAYDGVVAGGFRITDETPILEDSTEVTTDSSSRSMAIRNKYTYVVALLLSQNEAPVAPEIELGQMSLQAINNKNSIAVNLENLANAYAQEVRVEAVVSQNGGDVSFTTEQSNMKIAPASTLIFPIPVDEDLPAGEYQVSMTIYAETNPEGEYQAGGNSYNYRWELTDTFAIEERIVQGSNHSEVLTEKNNQWIYWLLFAGLSIVFIVVGILFQKKRIRPR